MKNIIILLLLVFSGLFSSQNRFKYQLKFKIDSTNRNFIQHEVFNLDVVSNRSIFYSQELAKLDSLKSTNSRLYINKKIEPKLDYIISYDSNTQDVFFTETVGASMFRMKEQRQLEWSISSEVKKIGNYSVQKATTCFGNRKWIAWFTVEIPIFDGPYKFKGLPGLVIKIYDSKKDYVFELLQIQKITKLYSFKYFEKLGLKTLSISNEEFNKLKKEDLENPEKALYQIPDFEKLNIPASQMRKIKERLINRRNKLNNTIELSMIDEIVENSKLT